jgi:hypothetical protein
MTNKLIPPTYLRWSPKLGRHVQPSYKFDQQGISPSVVNLTLLYNDNEGCHSRESGNPVKKTGFLIKSGMAFSVK